VSCRKKTDDLIDMRFLMKTQVGPLDHVLGGNLDPPGVGAILVWRGNGMINVDLYSTVITKVSNALNTLVSGEKPGNLGVVP